MDKILLSLALITPLIGNVGTAVGESGTVLRHREASGGIWSKKEFNFQKEVEFFFAPDYQECSGMFRNREHNREHRELTGNTGSIVCSVGSIVSSVGSIIGPNRPESGQKGNL